MYCIYFVCFIFLTFWTGQIYAYYSWYWWRYAYVPTPLITNSHYSKYFKENPTHRYHIQKSVTIASSECKRLFKYQRWNCESSKNKFLYPFGNIVELGCRETAYIYALTSASLTYHMVQACSEGRIDGCHNWCKFYKKKEKIDFKYISFMNETHLKNLMCDDNVRFGAQVWDDFVWKAETSQDVRTQVNLRNSQVGLQEVLKSSGLKCHCVGVSGSCTSKVCSEKIAENFRIVSNLVYKQYKFAKFDTPYKRLMANRYSRKKFTKSAEKRILRHKRHYVPNLEFFEYSPDFCQKTEHSNGMKNRKCLPHVSFQEYNNGVRSCDELCCHGRRSRIVEKTIQSNCTFVHCCHVKCNETKKKVEEFYCF